VSQLSQLLDLGSAGVANVLAVAHELDNVADQLVVVVGLVGEQALEEVAGERPEVVINLALRSLLCDGNNGDVNRCENKYEDGKDNAADASDGDDEDEDSDGNQHLLQIVCKIRVVRKDVEQLAQRELGKASRQPFVFGGSLQVKTLPNVALPSHELGDVPLAIES
jgi:hypothetical protein